MGTNPVGAAASPSARAGAGAAARTARARPAAGREEKTPLTPLPYSIHA